MFSKHCLQNVEDVLGNDLPGGLVVLADGNGSESGGCNLLVQVQADSWFVCDAESLGLRVAQVTPSTKIRERANSVCAEDARRCWAVSAVASRRIVEIMAERNCGSTTGRKESVRPCGPSSGLQGNEAARCESVLDGIDCRDLERKLCEIALGTVLSNKVRMSRGLPQGAPESPVIFTMIMELVLRDSIKSWITRKLAWRLDDFVLAAMCYADDVVLFAVSVTAAEVIVTEVIAELKEVGLTVGAQKTHWTSWTKASWWTDWLCCGRKSWSLWDQRCAWTGRRDMRSRTDQLKPTNVWRSGDLF